MASRVPDEDGLTGDQALLSLAHERFSKVRTVEAEWRRDASEELNFVSGRHWRDEEKAARKDRPCLVFDRISPSISQVTNDARQSQIEGRFTAVGGGADQKTAEILQGLSRNIDQDSGADVAYMTAYEYAVKIGRGWWRINIEYEDGDSFEQKILITRIANPFSVYPDPAAEQWDYSDMRFAFITEDLDRSIFKELYPDSLAGSLTDYTGIGDTVRDEWFPKGAVRVAEYWWVEIQETKIAQLSDGRVVPVDEVPEGLYIVNTRKKRTRIVHQALITGSEVLSESVWPGQWIPLVPVLGREIIKDGRRTLGGMIRPAMDSNLMFDYIASKIAEGFGLSALSQFLVAQGQLDGLEQRWADANRLASPYLEYKTTDAQGNQVPAPQRITPQINMGELSAGLRIFSDATKADLATFDASLGAPGPEQSGRAILARQREGDNAHFNYHDNLRRSMRHSTKIELDLFPHIYSEARMITILDPDGNSKSVMVNAPTIYQGLETIFRVGKDHIGASRYDVTLGSGRSYASRREQAAEQLPALAQAMPIIGQRAPDLVIMGTDLPGKELIAERIRPPDIQQDQDGQPVIPPQAMQTMAQQQQVIQALTAKSEALERTLQAKVMEIESRERIALIEAKAGILRAEIASKSSEMQTLAKLDHGAVEHQLDLRADLLHSGVTIEQDASGQPVNAVQPGPPAAEPPQQ